MSANNNSSEQSPLSRDELIRQLALQNPGDFAAIINAAQTNLTNNNTNSNNNTNNNNNNTHNNTNSDAAALDNAHLLLSLSGTTTTPAIGLPTPGADTLASQSTASNNNTNNSHNNTSAAGLSSIATNATNAILPAVRDGTGETPAARLKARPRKNLPSSTARKLPPQKQMPITTPIRTTGGTAAKRRSRAAAAADDSDDSEEEDSPSKKARTSDDSDDEKKMPAKSDRELRKDKRDKDKKSIQHDDEGTSSDDDTSVVEGVGQYYGRRDIKITHHGLHSKNNDYPQSRVSGLYAIKFTKVLCLGKSVNGSQGLAGRIKYAHGKGASKEVGEVTTFTGGNNINFDELEVFFCFFLRPLLPTDKDGEYDRDKIVSTEMLDLSRKREGVNIVAELEKMCKMLDSGNDVFDKCYGDSSVDKICFREINATSEVTHFKKHSDWKEWIRLRYSRTKEIAEKSRANQSHIDPAVWDAADTWAKKLAYNVRYEKRVGRFPANGPWGKWLAEQRDDWKEGKLSRDKVKALEGVGLYKTLADAKRQQFDEKLKSRLASLADYQDDPENGYGTHPPLTDRKSYDGLGKYIESVLITNFYEGKLQEETARELHDKYGLEMFNPDKLEQIEKVNRLGLGELKKRCEDFGINIYKEKVFKSNGKLLQTKTIRKRLLNRIFSPEEFTLTKVLPANEIRRRSAKYCNADVDDQCNRKACCIWTSDENPEKKLYCCMDCGADWPLKLPFDIIMDDDWYQTIMEECSKDRRSAEKNMSCVGRDELEEHVESKKKAKGASKKKKKKVKPAATKRKIAAPKKTTTKKK